MLLVLNRRINPPTLRRVSRFGGGWVRMHLTVVRLWAILVACCTAIESISALDRCDRAILGKREMTRARVIYYLTSSQTCGRLRSVMRGVRSTLLRS